MLATTAVQCMAQYKLLKRVVQRARAKTEMDDEDPLLVWHLKTKIFRFLWELQRSI
jgi:hypothetical protein